MTTKQFILAVIASAIGSAVFVFLLMPAMKRSLGITTTKGTPG